MSKQITEQSEMLHKSFPAVVANVDEVKGIVTAYVSIFGNIDEGDDIIHPKSFVKTLAERGHKIRVLDSHNSRSTLSAIGKVISIREVDRDELPAEILAEHSEVSGGLETITQFMLDDDTSAAVFRRIARGIISEYSIGFNIVQSDKEKITLPDGKTKVVTNIRQIRLYEYSPVIFAMNELTATGGVKSTDGKAEDAPEETEAPAVPLLAEWLTTDIMLHCQTVLMGMKWFGVIDEVEHDTITQLCNEHIERIRTDMPLGLALRPLDNSGMMMFSADGSDETKAGRVLSERNFNRIQQAADLLSEVLSAAGLTEESAADDSADKGMMIELQSEQLINDGPHDEPGEAPTSDEAGPRGEAAPSDRQSELSDRFQRLLA